MFRQSVNSTVVMHYHGLPKLDEKLVRPVLLPTMNNIYIYRPFVRIAVLSYITPHFLRRSGDSRSISETTVLDGLLKLNKTSNLMSKN